ncbi:MAG: glycosyltransferase family 2 protein [Chitinophagaceae bacterium]
MQTPTISVVLPAYNCGKYLTQAIDSVLQQTFTDFELIIINDGSTDDTEKIILSYNDKRIRYLKNDGNKGLIYTLNRGIDEARAEYIARMDGDDICAKERFEKQLNYLKENSHITAVALTITLIDEENNFIGYWKEDKNNITIKSIKKFLTKNNCIAHPTLMIRAAVFKKFRFDTRQKLSEDYDLWLRLTAAGYFIDKRDDILFQYRILNNSFTRTRKYNVLTRIGIVQINFFFNQLKEGKINSFVFQVLIGGIINRLMGFFKPLKKAFINNKK